MHIPRYYKKPGWQRFLVGVFFGALISYWVVLFMYGTMYERLLKEYSTSQDQLHDAQNKIAALEKDNEDLGEKTKKPLTVEEIDLEILNAESLKIDKLLQHELEGLVKKEVEVIIGNDVETIGRSYALLLSSIENKTFKVDDFTYSFEIERLIIAPNVIIVVTAKISN